MVVWSRTGLVLRYWLGKGLSDHGPSQSGADEGGNFREGTGQARAQVVDGGLVANGAGAEVLVGEGLIGSRQFEVRAAAAEIADAGDEAAGEFALDIELVLQELRGVRILIEEADAVADIS